MKVPNQASPVTRRTARKIAMKTTGLSPQGCGVLDEIKCGAMAAGVVAGCATIAIAGPAGVAACGGAIAAYVAASTGSECWKCSTGGKDSICGFIRLINDIAPGTISVPSWC